MRAVVDDIDSTQIAAKDHIAPQRDNLEEEKKEKKISTQTPAIICSPHKGLQVHFFSANVLPPCAPGERILLVPTTPISPDPPLR